VGLAVEDVLSERALILGTTGEGSLLSTHERQVFTAAVLEAVHGELPVMAGVGAVDTRAVCAQVAELDAFELAGYLVGAAAVLPEAFR
jgi:4-hydroxy-tetrahydrodipicolinate synthase